MLAGLTGFHLILIVGIVVLLFGATKLPVLAKSLGQSAKILKREMKTMNDDETSAKTVPADAPRAEPLPHS